MSTPSAPIAGTRPASYAWEATDEELAARYGLAIDDILRFDLNTSPYPPELAAAVMAEGRFDTVLSEYPPADYRRLVEAAAAAFGVRREEILVGAGADEVLDVVAKAFLPPGGRAVVPTPTYAMYRVLTEQRGATVVAVPRRTAADGWAMDIAATIDAARDADLVWLCSPNNPTALAEPDGAVEQVLDGIAGAPRAAGGRAPVVVLDEAYAEFAGRSLVGLRERYPNLVVIRTASKAYALAGLRVGFAVARPETIAELAPYRPPASISIVSAAVVTAAMADDTAMRANVARVEGERERLAEALRDAGWRVGPSVTNFLLVDFGSASRATAVALALQRRGLVPRTFGASHPLTAFLRLTVRDAAGNDRIIAAARETGS